MPKKAGKLYYRGEKMVTGAACHAALRLNLK
jgi:hypothetical protein